jgi:hypothetical protein
MKCDLCNAVDSDSFQVFGNFILIPKCKTCGIPILVLREHRAFLFHSEQKEFAKIVAVHFPDKKARGIGMKSEPHHYHEHLSEK